MNKKATRFFQGLTLTTFSMGVLNTISNVNNKEKNQKMAQIIEDIRNNQMVNNQNLDNKLNTIVKKSLAI